MRLVRNSYVDIIDNNLLDASPKDDEAKLSLILDKFKEEALEFLESKQRNPEELADLTQVAVDWRERDNGLSFDIINHLRK